jgi:hypothetical protein
MIVSKAFFEVYLGSGVGCVTAQTQQKGAAQPAFVLPLNRNPGKSSSPTFRR